MKKNSQISIKLPMLSETPRWRGEMSQKNLNLEPLVSVPFKVKSRKELYLSPRYPKDLKLPPLLSPVSKRASFDNRSQDYLLGSKLYRLSLQESNSLNIKDLLFKRHKATNSDFTETLEGDIITIEKRSSIQTDYPSTQNLPGDLDYNNKKGYSHRSSIFANIPEEYIDPTNPIYEKRKSSNQIPNSKNQLDTTYTKILPGPNNLQKILDEEEKFEHLEKQKFSLYKDAKEFISQPIQEKELNVGLLHSTNIHNNSYGIQHKFTQRKFSVGDNNIENHENIGNTNWNATDKYSSDHDLVLSGKNHIILGNSKNITGDQNFLKNLTEDRDLSMDNKNFNIEVYLPNGKKKKINNLNDFNRRKKCRNTFSNFDEGIELEDNPRPKSLPMNLNLSFLSLDYSEEFDEKNIEMQIGLYDYMQSYDRSQVLESKIKNEKIHNLEYKEVFVDEKDGKSTFLNNKDDNLKVLNIIQEENQLNISSHNSQNSSEKNIKLISDKTHEKINNTLSTSNIKDIGKILEKNKTPNEEISDISSQMIKDAKKTSHKKEITNKEAINASSQNVKDLKQVSKTKEAKADENSKITNQPDEKNIKISKNLDAKIKEIKSKDQKSSRKNKKGKGKNKNKKIINYIKNEEDNQESFGHTQGEIIDEEKMYIENQSYNVEGEQLTINVQKLNSYENSGNQLQNNNKKNLIESNQNESINQNLKISENFLNPDSLNENNPSFTNNFEVSSSFPTIPSKVFEKQNSDYLNKKKEISGIAPNYEYYKKYHSVNQNSIDNFIMNFSKSLLFTINLLSKKSSQEPPNHISKDLQEAYLRSSGRKTTDQVALFKKKRIRLEEKINSNDIQFQAIEKYYQLKTPDILDQERSENFYIAKSPPEPSRIEKSPVKIMKERFKEIEEEQKLESEAELKKSPIRVSISNPYSRETKYNFSSIKPNYNVEKNKYEESSNESLEEDSEKSVSSSNTSEESSSGSTPVLKNDFIRSSALYEAQNFELISNLAKLIYCNNPIQTLEMSSNNKDIDPNVILSQTDAEKLGEEDYQITNSLDEIDTKKLNFSGINEGNYKFFSNEQPLFKNSNNNLLYENLNLKEEFDLENMQRIMQKKKFMEKPTKDVEHDYNLSHIEIISPEENIGEKYNFTPMIELKKLRISKNK